MPSALLDLETAATTLRHVGDKAEELDRDLPSQLASFTESIAKSESNLEEVKTQHTAAIKTVEAKNKKRLDERKKTNGSEAANVTPAKTIPPVAEFKDGKPVFGTKPPITVTGESRNRFDSADTGPEKTSGEAISAEAMEPPSPLAAPSTASGDSGANSQ